MNDHGFFNIAYTFLISISGALAKEINDKAKGHESLSVFFGEIILHGFSGWIFGLMAQKYLGLTDFTSITIFAGIGGLFGFDLVKMVLKFALKFMAAAKNVDLKDSDLNTLDDNNKEK